MQTLYPFKLTPVFKEKVWGGNKIKSLLLNNTVPVDCGEAWLVSGIEGSSTIINNGFLAGNELRELVEVYMGDLVGDDLYSRFGNEFPLLLKIIDANDWLSVQVHPDDTLAKKRHNGSGKTEMWYILQSDKNAELINGFNRKTNKKE
ncbi:MAG: mannose-6-phosphate isomerase, partial [Bacteroidales bacterium]|nr:mannose-6-phosphate isomerase [Bacteroidales bacterium]